MFLNSFIKDAIRVSARTRRLAGFPDLEVMAANEVEAEKCSAAKKVLEAVKEAV